MDMAGGVPARGSGEHSELVSLLPALRAFARTFHRHPSDADDLVQQTLTKAITHADKFQPGTNMKSWLFTIMRNECYSAARSTKRRLALAPLPVEATVTGTHSQEWTVRASEMAKAIDALPAAQREAIVLVGMLGFSYDEAADICDCAIGTIKSRLNRARGHLAEHFAEEGTADVRGFSEHVLRIGSSGT
jgi:RNA polymerase sigma-70 factor (ECF subfamily)